MLVLQASQDSSKHVGATQLLSFAQDLLLAARKVRTVSTARPLSVPHWIAMVSGQLLMLLEPVQRTCPGLDGFLEQLCLLVAGVALFSTVLLWLTAPSPPSSRIKSPLPAVTTAACCVAEGLPGIATGSCATRAHQHLQLPLVQVRSPRYSLGLAPRGMALSLARAQLSLGIAWPVRVRSSAHYLTRCCCVIPQVAIKSGDKRTQCTRDDCGGAGPSPAQRCR